MARGWGMTTPWNGVIEAGSRALGALLFLGALLLPAGAAALKHGEPIRIGALTTSWGPTPAVVGLRDGLVELGDVIGGRSPGRTSEEQITVADLTGVAVQDIQISKAVYKTLRSGLPSGVR